jgi:hypothetical protein
VLALHPASMMQSVPMVKCTTLMTFCLACQYGAYLAMT